jgi:transcriptional regulator GlxA family with amidase domain
MAAGDLRSNGMQRREFIARSALALISSGAGIGAASSAFASPNDEPETKMSNKPTLAFVVYPGMTPMDIVGPATVLTGSDFKVEFVWRDMQPVEGEMPHVLFRPTTTFSKLKQVDILCVTGTGNPYALLEEYDMLDWMHEVGGKAQWVTSVCTGSVLLGAAGLMNGYKATTHWAMMDDLKAFGAVPVDDRVVVDRNRISGGGVTAGIDFGLTMNARLLGEESAKARQLLMQYDPHPPFRSGTPSDAGEDLAGKVRGRILGGLQQRTPDWQRRLKSSAERSARYT